MKQIVLKPEIKEGDKFIFNGEEVEAYRDYVLSFTFLFRKKDGKTLLNQDGQVVIIDIGYDIIELPEEPEKQGPPIGYCKCGGELETHIADEGTGCFGKCKKCGWDLNKIEEVPPEQCECEGGFQVHQIKCGQCKKQRPVVLSKNRTWYIPAEYNAEQKPTVDEKEAVEYCGCRTPIYGYSDEKCVNCKKHIASRCVECDCCRSSYAITNAYDNLVRKLEKEIETSKKPEGNPFNLREDVTVYEVRENGSLSFWKGFIADLSRHGVLVAQKDKTSPVGYKARWVHYKQCERIDE